MEITCLFVHSPVGGERAGPPHRGAHAVPHTHSRLLDGLLATAEHIEVVTQHQLRLVDVKDIGVVKETVIPVLVLLVVSRVELLQGLTLDHLQPLGVMESDMEMMDIF